MAVAKSKSAARPVSEKGLSPPRSLLIYIQALVPSLNRTEQLIASGILKDPERVLYSSISEMAQFCSASVGSIVKFCRNLGYAGFSSFKIALAQDLAQSGFSMPGAPENVENANLFQAVFDFHAQSLKETLQINGSKMLEKAARVLDQAKKIEFFSVGLSYPIAYTAFCKFKLIGMPVSIEADAHMQLIAATQLGAKDVALGVSCSGSTRGTVECLATAKGKKAKTICLTNSVRSPITRHADVALYATPSEIKYFQAPLASRVTQLALIDALFVSIALLHKGEATSRLHEAGEKLLEHRIS